MSTTKRGGGITSVWHISLLFWSQSPHNLFWSSPPPSDKIARYVFGKIFKMSLFWSHLLRRSVWPISVLISHLLLINRSALVPRLLGGSHSKHINLGRSEKISDKGIKHRKTFQLIICFDQTKQSNKTKLPNKTEEKTTFAAKHLF